LPLACVNCLPLTDPKDHQKMSPNIAARRVGNPSGSLAEKFDVRT
jgi:hypothetical protein